MKKRIYTLVYDTYVEKLDAETLLLRFDQAEERGYHIEICPSGYFDFMVCFW